MPEDKEKTKKSESVATIETGVLPNTIQCFIHISKQTYKATLTYFYR